MKNPAHAAPAFRPLPAGLQTRSRFVRGSEQPKGVVWFGVRSFWGHLRHFLAAAIATEDVDSRDWMTADEPQELQARVAEVLGGNIGAARRIAIVGLGQRGATPGHRPTAPISVIKIDTS